MADPKDPIVVASIPLDTPEVSKPSDTYPYLYRTSIDIRSSTPGGPIRVMATLVPAKVDGSGNPVLVDATLAAETTITTRDLAADVLADVMTAADPAAVQAAADDAVVAFYKAMAALPTGGKIVYAIQLAQAAMTAAVELVGKQKKLL